MSERIFASVIITPEVRASGDGFRRSAEAALHAAIRKHFSKLLLNHPLLQGVHTTPDRDGNIHELIGEPETIQKIDEELRRESTPDRLGNIVADVAEKRSLGHDHVRTLLGEGPAVHLRVIGNRTVFPRAPSLQSSLS